MRLHCIKELKANDIDSGIPRQSISKGGVLVARQQKAKKHSLRAFIENAVIVFVLGSLFVAYTANKLQIDSQQQALEAVQVQVAQQQADNEELQYTLESGSLEMLERIARDQYDYAQPNERVFIDMSGK